MNSNVDSKLDPEEDVAREILSKVFRLKLEDAMLWRFGLNFYTSTSRNAKPKASFTILQGPGIPRASQGRAVALKIGSKFFRHLGIPAERKVSSLVKPDRDFVWTSIFGNGAPIGVFFEEENRGGGHEGFCFDSLEQALLEFSLKEGISLG